MKKILNWLVGSFFRTIGRFLAFLTLGGIAAFICFKNGIKITDFIGIDTIYADTGTYSSSIWSLRTINPNLSDCTYTTDNQLICSSRSYDSNRNLGEYYFDNTYNDMSVLVSDVRLYAYASSSDKFLSSRFYTFNYTICQSNHVSLSTLKSKTVVSQWGYNSSNAATGASMSNGSEVTLLISEVEGTTTINNTTSYCYNYQFSVTPKIDSRFIGFYIHYGSTNGEFVVADTVNRAGKLYSVKSLDVTYTTGTGAIVQDSANQIINNQNQNSQDIINNQNQNTQDIINNQNQNTQDTINSQKVCITKQTSYNSAPIKQKFLQQNGSEVSIPTYNITDYIEINEDTEIKVLIGQSTNNAYYCFYYQNKELISCFPNQLTEDQILTIPNNAKYFRSSIYQTDKPVFEIKTCKDGNQAVSDSLNDSDTSEASSDALDFFNSFNDDSHGLTSILTAPLNSIRLMLSDSDSCVAPSATYKGQTFSLPCGNILWSRPGASALNSFLNVVYGGLISYYLVVNLLHLVNNFKNPDNDKIEVADL